MGKKNLDKLFQEKLSNFSEAPDEKVWQSINASLDEKKKSRKIIPLWWKFGGVAAVLAIGLFIINPFKDAEVSTPSVTDIETPKEKTNSEVKEQNAIKVLDKIDETEIVDSDAQIELEEPTTLQEEVSNTGIANSEKRKEKSPNVNVPAEKTAIQIASQNTKVVREQLHSDSNTDPSPENNTILNKNADEAIAVQDNSKTNNSSNNAIENKATGETSGEISGQPNNSSLDIQTGIAQSEEVEKAAEKIDPKKKSIFDEIAKQEEEKEVLAENKNGKWYAGASVAPVYFDAIGEGSPVHSIFVPNSKSGDLNLSYGLSVAYEVSSKLKIRSGIHRVDYGYSTNDVEFSSSLESSAIGQIANVNYSATGKNIVVASSASPEVAANTMNDLVADDFSGQGLSQNGAMTQQFGYLEVPVELEY
ncbi:MAG: hypothetical protein AB8B59_17160, partial [Maribacter sp.]